MRKIYLTAFSFFIILHAQVISQHCTVHGIVRDEYGAPIPFAVVEEHYTSIRATTDFDGHFRISLSNCDSAILRTSYVGYETKKINVNGNSEVVIKMIPYSLIANPQPKQISSKPFFLGIIGSFGIDFTEADFYEFENLLGEENVSFIGKTAPIVFFSIEPSYKNIFANFQFGLMNFEEYEPDSIQKEFSQKLYGLSAGYYIIHSKHFILAPELALKLFRYRLLNFESEDQIPIELYLENRELDLRFKQLLGYAGIKVLYKMNTQGLNWAVGVYAGYLGKLNKEPWIRSARNQILSDKRINYENLSFGITFSIFSL